ncbi:MAG: rhodanese-like domain-containing protein [Deltaproteobacteria bacterium]|nr:rhodanese-like domain-containing protein [Deltaproteobacteria bacterium]
MTKKTTIPFVVLILGVGLYWSCSNSAIANGPAQTDPAQFGEEVSVHTVNAMKGKPGVVVLDVRTPSEYNDEHIPGVVHIPMDQVAANR